MNDIRFGSGSLEAILMRTRRVAQACGDGEVDRWLGYELAGYPAGQVESDVQTLLDRAGIPSGVRREKFLNSSVLSIAAGLGKLSQATEFNQRQVQLGTSRRNFPATAYSKDSVTAYEKSRNDAYITESERLQLVQTVLTEVDRYVTDVFLRFAYLDTAFRLFERHRIAVNRMLKAKDPDLYDKLPSVFERLKNNDVEAISGALNTIRRLIVALTDELQPVDPKNKEVDGHRLTPADVLNRLTEWLKHQSIGAKRRDRLDSTMRGIWPYVSKGVHVDVSLHEAQSLALQALMMVGEYLEISFDSATASPTSASNSETVI